MRVNHLYPTFVSNVKSPYKDSEIFARCVIMYSGLEFHPVLMEAV